jgi:hypothetical protein
MLAKACRVVAFYLSKRFDSPPWPSRVGDAKLFIVLTYQKKNVILATLKAIAMMKKYLLAIGLVE